MLSTINAIIYAPPDPSGSLPALPLQRGAVRKEYDSTTTGSETMSILSNMLGPSEDLKIDERRCSQDEKELYDGRIRDGTSNANKSLRDQAADSQRSTRIDSTTPTTCVDGAAASDLLWSEMFNKNPHQTRNGSRDRVREKVRVRLSKSEKGREFEKPADSLADINFNAEKLSTTKADIMTLAQILDCEIFETEWLVTGRVNPVYFSDDFQFLDHSLMLTRTGIENYARMVHDLYEQSTTRAEVLSTLPCPHRADQIVCTWRLSGYYGDGMPIKAQICRTTYTVDGAGLIAVQENFSEVPEWDALLSNAIPFLNGRVTAEEAPPAPERRPPVHPLRTAATGPFGLSLPDDSLNTLLASVQSSVSQLCTGVICI